VRAVHAKSPPYGVPDDPIIKLIVTVGDPYSLIEITHATLAERQATPAYEVAYKDHGGDNRYLHLDAYGHVIGWGIENPL
jgi:hypothetical protein